MTQVWRTLKGNRYHRVADCPGITEGHAKASSEGYRNHPAQAVELGRQPRGLQPCLRCWGEAFRGDPWLFKVLETEAQGDTEHEQHFLEDVLRRIPRLEPDHISVQHSAIGSSGSQYYLDFAIVRPGGPKIAIEIDGFQKDRNRNEADDLRLASASARQNDLTSAGWLVLRFTNRQVITVPSECRKQVESVLIPAEQSLTQPSVRPNLALDSQAAEQEAGWSAWEKALLGLVVVAATILAATLMFVLGWLPNGVAGTSNEQQGGANQSRTADPLGKRCPQGYPVKGNVTANNERIYHLRGWRFYTATRPETCFDSQYTAEDAGYRASEIQ